MINFHPRLNPPHRHRRAALLLLLVAMVAPAAAQRSYHEYWRKQWEKREEPVIIEDDAPMLDPSQQTLLFGETGSELIGSMGFVPPGALDKKNAEPIEALNHYTRGVLSMAAGSPNIALEEFAKAVDLEPENLRYRLRAAEAAIAINDLSRAKALLDAVLERDPENVEAMVQMGQSWLLRNRFGDARGWFEKVVEVQPGNIEALRTLAQLSYDVDRDFEKTKEYAQKILFIDDRNLYALLWGAEAHALTGDIEKSREYYERLLRLRPSLIERMAMIASRLISAGRIEDGAALYQLAVQTNPRSTQIRVTWEDLMRRTGGEAKIRAGYEALVEQSARDTRIQDLYADYLKRTGDWETLLKVRREILASEPMHIGSLLDLASYYIENQDFESAEPWLESAISRNTNDPEIFREIGRIYVRVGNSGKARPMLEEAIRLNPEDVEATDLLAAVFEAEGNHSEATRMLSRALQVSPANPFLLKRLGSLHLSIGELRPARDYYQQALATSPEDVSLWIDLAEVYYRMEDSSGMALLEEQATLKLGANPLFDVRIGNLAMRFADWERSRRAFERSLQAVPSDLNVRASLARVYLQLDLSELAVRSIEEGRSHLPPELDPIVIDQLVASIHSMAGEHLKAEKLYRQLLEQGPAELELHRALMDALIAQGRPDEAREQLDRVMATLGSDRHRDVQLLQADMLVRLGDSARAVGRLRTLQEEFPDDGDVRLKLANAAADSGDLETAERELRALIALGSPPQNPYYETASNNLGYLFVSNKVRLDEAEKLLQDALSLNPNAAYILDSIGWLHYQRQDYETARGYLEKAARLSISDSEIFLHLAQVYERLGRIEDARTYYDRAVRHAPDSTEARQLRDAFAASHPAKGGAATR